MSVVLLGSTSGSVTLQEPAVAGSTVITLPATSGTMASIATVNNNGVLYANSSGQPTTTSTFVFDGTNVGIGTASPGVRLEVSGASAASSFNALRMANTDTTASSPVTTLFQSADDGTLRNRATMTSGSDGSNNGYIALSTRSSGSITEKLRLNSTGALVLAGGSTTANGVGITFPATQSASSNVNTLDDYEEGTFTPVFTVIGGTLSVIEQSGQYTKIGNRVLFNIYVNVNISVAGSGNITFEGLPFQVGTWNVTTFWSSLVAWGGVTVSPLAWSGNTYVALTTISSGASYGSLTATTVGTGNSKEFRISGSYNA